MPCGTDTRTRTGSSKCGQKELQQVRGQNVQSEHLCMFHWMFVHGQRDYAQLIVKEP